jgi:metal-sulfur cluster biosynthetic enzyme
MVVSRRRHGNARERGKSGVSGCASDADPIRATADATRTVLEGIVDPCSRAVGAPAGLVSMGLVLDVSVSGTPGAAIVNVKLGVTEPGCMMQGIFSAAAERAIRALPGVIDVVVRIDHGYVWDPDAMTAAYRARLSRVRAERTLRAEQRRR